MKDREFYAKLVFGGRWKKVDKFLASGELEEKTTIMEAFGAAVKSNVLQPSGGGRAEGN